MNGVDGWKNRRMLANTRCGLEALHFEQHPTLPLLSSSIDSLCQRQIAFCQ